MADLSALNRTVLVRVQVPQPFFGQVGEWLIPADCKSAAYGLR